MLYALLYLLAVAAPPPTLEGLSATLREAPAWNARFEQRYVPAGFDDGTTDGGTLVLAAPSRLRFDYDGEPPRVFAFDGSVARMVDLDAETCDAVLLDRGERGSLPLAVLAEPQRQAELFAVRQVGSTLVLTPREPDVDIAEIRIEADGAGLPRSFTVTDAAGNRNEFVFTGWREAAPPSPETFTPALPHRAPCSPPDR